MGAANWAYMQLLARSGYAVLAPDSFARRDRPSTCDPRRHSGIPGAPFRRVAEMRQEEIRHAARRLAELPWVDRENLFLMGHSQGGSAAAAYEGADFKARVITGSICQLGLRAPPAAPVISLYSERDPWLRGRSPRGCEERARGRGIPIEFHLFPGSDHNLAHDAEAQRLILDFLARHTKRRP